MLLTVQLSLIAILAYTWVGYPLILRAVAGRKRRLCPPHPASRPPHPASRVSIIVAAHNEEQHIGERIENLLHCVQRLVARCADQTTCSASRRPDDPDPASRISILVGCDACTDRTVEIAQSYAQKHENVHVFDFKERRGKVAVLKDLVAASAAPNTQQPTPNTQCPSAESSWPSGSPTSDTPHSAFRIPHLLVFTDANTEFHEDALVKLLAPFADQAIGGVCGKLVLSARHDDRAADFTTKDTRLRPSATARQAKSTKERSVPHSAFRIPHSPEGAYWRWENKLKQWESDLDSCLGANGAIYAIRRELFWSEIPSNTIIDDFVIGMKVREKGRRMVYEPAAMAHEELPETKHEWSRRVRIGTGDYQALALCWRFLWPLPEFTTKGTRLRPSATARQAKITPRRQGYGGQAKDMKEEEDKASPAYPESRCPDSRLLSPVAFPCLFWSHKVLRWFTPHILLVLLAVAVVGLGVGLTGLLSLLTVLGFVTLLCAALSVVVMGTTQSMPGRVFRGVRHWIMMQAALLVGFVRFTSGGVSGHWNRTAREC